jgi:hypothetical protein
MWVAGIATADIAQFLGTTKNAVWSKARYEAWGARVRHVQPASIWKPDVIDTAKRMWGAGDSASVIAKALGIPSRNAVLGKAWHEGWPRPARKVIWTPEVVKIAKRMWAAGDSSYVIGKALGITKSTMFRKIRVWRAGAPAQRRHAASHGDRRRRHGPPHRCPVA